MIFRMCELNQDPQFIQQTASQSSGKFSPFIGIEFLGSPINLAEICSRFRQDWNYYHEPGKVPATTHLFGEGSHEVHVTLLLSRE